MASLRMRMVLIIIGLLFPLPHSFVIRKRSVVGSYDFLKEESTKSDDPGPEEDWTIPGQQRSRSELLFDPFSRGIYVSRVPERSSAPLDRLTIPPRPYEEEEEDYRLGDEDDLGFNGGRYDGGPGLIPDEEEEEEENDGEAEAEGEGGTTLLNKSELKSMFEKDSTGVGKVPSPPGHRSPTELTKKDVAELLGPPESPKKSGGLRQQQQQLKEVVGETRVLVGAAAAAAASANGSSVAAPSSYEGVRVIEVTESDPDGQTRTQKQTQWLMSPPAGLLGPNEGSPAPMAPGGDGDDDDGWRLGNSVFGRGGGGGGDEVQRVTRKVKRSELSTPEEDEEEEAAEQNDVELLKTYIRLQTEENRHLEQALNFAISTQVENSDAYLAGEIDQLRLAVENEEALETIRTAIRRRQLRQENGPEGEEEDGEGEEEGDGDGEEEGNGDVEREEDEEEEEEERRMIDDDAVFAKTLLKAKLKKFLVDSAVEDLRERAYEDELEAREGGVGEEDEEGEEEGEDVMFPKAKVLNPFTRQALGEYRNTKRNEERDEAAEFEDDVEAMPRDADDLDITDLLDTPVPTETGYCPVVQQLTDDCAAARSQRLVLDAEALSLCNRHQICYLCGPVFGMTRDSCDRGYLGESERLCSGGEQCTSEAVGLYLVMAKAHRLTAPSPAAAFGAYDVCAADCVYDYIVGESDDRR